MHPMTALSHLPHPPWFPALALVSLLFAPFLAGHARAQGAVPAVPVRPLACAIEAAPVHDHGLDDLCAKLRWQLQRDVVSVPDARGVKSGQALEVIETEMIWYVVLLEGGRVRAFTRIYAAEAHGREVLFVARAFQGLVEARAKSASTCLHLAPRTRAHTTDLVYPWPELLPCTQTTADLRDPWWEPAPSP
jgi:hypothetical protein